MFSVLGDKDVDGILVVLELVFDFVVVIYNGLLWVLDVEVLVLVVGEWFGFDWVCIVENLCDVIDVVILLVDDVVVDLDVVGDVFLRIGIVIIGLVVIVGVVWILFGCDL